MSQPLATVEVIRKPPSRVCRDVPKAGIYFGNNSRAIRTDSPEVDMKINSSVTASIDRRNMRTIGPRAVRRFSARSR
jgi:hypothetical protein